LTRPVYIGDDYRTYIGVVTARMATISEPGTKKYCFVTIGATASFTALIRAVLSPSFLAGLKAHNYTNLLVQYGADGAYLYRTELGETRKAGQDRDITVEGFSLDQSGLGKYMSLAKTGGDGKGQEGVVVSHAGNTFCSLLLQVHLSFETVFV